MADNLELHFGKQLELNLSVGNKKAKASNVHFVYEGEGVTAIWMLFTQNRNKLFRVYFNDFDSLINEENQRKIVMFFFFLPTETLRSWEI